MTNTDTQPLSEEWNFEKSFIQFNSIEDIERCVKWINNLLSEAKRDAYKKGWNQGSMYTEKHERIIFKSKLEIAKKEAVEEYLKALPKKRDIYVMFHKYNQYPDKVEPKNVLENWINMGFNLAIDQVIKSMSELSSSERK